MSGRLRRLPFWGRLLAYLVGSLLAFLVALAAGAGTALVVDWRQDPAEVGAGRSDDPRNLQSAESAETIPDGNEETSGPDRADPDAGTTFVHRATGGNSRGDYTYLSHPEIDGDPDAFVFVEPAPDEGSAGDGAYDHNLGVWYEPGKRKWAVFNQDRAAVPAGTAFRIAIPKGPGTFVHRFSAPDDTLTSSASASASASPSGGAPANDTYLDHPLLNGEPEADLSVTQNWNPGGGGGVYNDHPVDIRYDPARERWVIFNQDLASFKDGASFNVSVAEPDKGSRAG